MAEPHKVTGKRRGPYGGQTPQRLAVVRELIAKCWSYSQIKEHVQNEWGVSRRTGERYIRIVLAESRRDYEQSKREMLPELILQMKAHYEMCVAQGQMAAAGKFFDRMISVTGLDVKRVELTGAAGGPIKVTSSIDMTKFSDEQLALLGSLIGTEEEPESAEPEAPTAH